MATNHWPPVRSVRVTIGFPAYTDSRKPINPTIEIVNDTTGVFIAQLEFTPEEFVRLLAGAVIVTRDTA